MTKFWKIYSFEYSRQVFRKRFLFGLLSVPAIIVMMILVVFLTIAAEMNSKPVGYIDRSGLLTHPLSRPAVAAPEKPVGLIPYQDEAAAMAALKSGKIQAYYVLGADYLQTGQAERVSVRPPGSSAESQFKDFVRANLLASLPGSISQRLTQGDHLVVRSVDGSRQIDQGNWITILIPIFTGLALMIAIFASSGYLMNAVVEEKENRTMEILASSASPTQIMIGKALAMISLGLTQLLAWALFGLGLLALGARGLTLFQTIQLSPWSLLPILLVFLPSFVTVAALMIIVGSTVADAREGQQIAGMLTLPIVLPYWFALPLMTHPESLLATALSVFPLTAPVT
ncbi:MAG: type transport system permease protein, partial [Chloroflexi bacterium]|nr:type transport system permease protein [Chloroflexota bacterium]